MAPQVPEGILIGLRRVVVPKCFFVGVSSIFFASVVVLVVVDIQNDVSVMIDLAAVVVCTVVVLCYVCR